MVDVTNTNQRREESMNTHKEEILRYCERCSKIILADTICNCSLEPTPPSQIEEESQTQRSLREMYELGKEHGRTLALKDMEIEKLKEELKGKDKSL